MSALVSRAVHLFKEAFGTTIMHTQWTFARAWPRNGLCLVLSLEDVAETSGFANYTYFHRVFRSRFGVSPKQFRMASRTSN